MHDPIESTPQVESPQHSRLRRLLAVAALGVAAAVSVPTTLAMRGDGEQTSMPEPAVTTTTELIEESPATSLPIESTATTEAPEPEPATTTTAAEVSTTAAPDRVVISRPEVIAKKLEMPQLTAEHKAMLQDTVFIPGVGCSGRALYDAAGELAVIETASHCFDTERTEGSDGKRYLPFSRQRDIYRNNGTEKLGMFSHAVLATDSDGTDVGLLIPSGRDIESARKLYRDMSAGDKFESGSKLFIGAYLANKPTELQTWPGIALDTLMSPKTDGAEPIPIRYAAIPRSNQGNTWAQGGSGAGAIGEKGQLRGTVLGVENNATIRQDLQARTAFDLNGYEIIALTASDPSDVLIVADHSEIPR